MRLRTLWLVALLSACEGAVLGPRSPASGELPSDVPGSGPGGGDELPAVACTPTGPGRAALRRLNTAQLEHALQDLLALPQPVKANLPPELLSPSGYDDDGAYQSAAPELVTGLADVTSAALTLALATPQSPVAPCPGAAVPPLEVPRSSPWVFLDVQGTVTKPVTGPQTTGSWLVFDIPASAVTRGFDTLVLHASATASGGVWPQLQVNFNDVQVVGALTLDSAAQKPYAIALSVAPGMKAKVGLYLKNAATDGSRRAEVVKLELTSRAVAGLDAACVKSAVAKLGRLAFRRDLTTEELDAYAKLSVDAAAEGLDAREAQALSLQAVLLSPHFLFHVMAEHSPDDPAAVHRLSDSELAARLAAFLWVSVPDEALLQAAQRGELGTEAGLRAAVQRMLADPKARRFSDAFAGQWLETRRVADVNRASSVIAEFDAPLRAAMQAETAALFDDVLRRDASPVELLTAPYTFVDARLAAFYGLPAQAGAAPVRVQLDGTHRLGVLTQAAVMTVTSKPDHSSPVGRGVFVLGQLLCDPPGAPPADATMDLTTGPGGEDLSGLSPREQLTKVTSPARCQGCHARINPVGFAFEHFDAVGRWRERDGQFDVDASGELRGVGTFSDPEGLVRLLAEKKRSAIERCVTRHLLTFATGRAVTSADQCTLDTVARGLAEGRGLAGLVADVAASEPFRARAGGN